MSSSFWQKRGNKIISYDVKSVNRHGNNQPLGSNINSSPRGRTTYYDHDSPIKQRMDDQFIIYPTKMATPRHGDSPVRGKLKKKMRHVLEEAGTDCKFL
jgi:hypothetical protein